MPVIYGWQKDRPRPDDKIYDPPKKLVMNLPESVDLESICSPVEDQGEIGSCTGNATVGQLEALLSRDGKVLHDLSRLMVYWGARKLGGGPVDQDTGAQIRDCYKWMSKYGTCIESLWPYVNVENTFKEKPSDAAFKDALNHQILNYYNLDRNKAPSSKAIESVLAQRYCVAFGFSVPEWFVDEVGASGVMRLPNANDHFDGGHAVLIVGYNRKTKQFKVRNSWGPGWGQKGYFYAPYDFVCNKDYCDDFWYSTLQESE